MIFSCQRKSKAGRGTTSQATPSSTHAHALRLSLLTSHTKHVLLRLLPHINTSPGGNLGLRPMDVARENGFKDVQKFVTLCTAERAAELNARRKALVASGTKGGGCGDDFSERKTVPL